MLLVFCIIVSVIVGVLLADAFWMALDWVCGWFREWMD